MLIFEQFNSSERPINQEINEALSLSVRSLPVELDSISFLKDYEAPNSGVEQVRENPFKGVIVSLKPLSYINNKAA